MAATGADHVFAVGAGSNGGIFEAASEQDFTAYGVDVNQCPDAPGFVGDGTLKFVDVLVVSEIGKILDGTADSISSYGLAEGGMDVVSLTDEAADSRSEEHTSELQSRGQLVCRLLLEKKKK